MCEAEGQTRLVIQHVCVCILILHTLPWKQHQWDFLTHRLATFIAMARPMPIKAELHNLYKLCFFRKCSSHSRIL